MSLWLMRKLDIDNIEFYGRMFVHSNTQSATICCRARMSVKHLVLLLANSGLQRHIGMVSPS